VQDTVTGEFLAIL